MQSFLSVMCCVLYAMVVYDEISAIISWPLLLSLTASLDTGILLFLKFFGLGFNDSLKE
jgi:hypothetical protein